ncbi:hypothetical protein Tco_0356650 [Tanacetum coccineum]
MERNMTTLEDQVQDSVHGEREENKKLKKRKFATTYALSRERPRDATIVPVSHLDPDDPCVSAATGVLIVHEETPSPELRGSPRDSQ